MHIAVGRRGHRLGFGGVRGERLLAQDVLTGRDRLQRPLRVQRVRQRVVDGVDLGIGEQRLVPLPRESG